MHSEFDFIQNIKLKYGLTRVGDDCAVLPKDDKTDMVVTADMLVEGIDFRLDWTTPEFLGHKALAVSLSDIAAMGAKPEWALLSIGVPPGLWGDHFLDMFYTGWHELAGEYGVELVGGDVSRVPDHLVIDSIVGGIVPRSQAVLRSGARPGEGIYVTGRLGGAAAGLRWLQSGTRLESLDEKELLPVLLQQLRPNPRVGAGEYLRANAIATAMIDISDGLSSDLAHLIKASGVGARIDAGLIPIEKRDSILATTSEEFENALHGGEDFELLFTVDPKKNLTDNSMEFFRIGEITANIGTIQLIKDDEDRILEPKGHRHF